MSSVEYVNGFFLAGYFDRAGNRELYERFNKLGEKTDARLAVKLMKEAGSSAEEIRKLYSLCSILSRSGCELFYAREGETT